MTNMKYTPVIGLEIHVELKTKSKMFCQCEADYFGKKPNTNTCPVCLGMPGALPIANKTAVEWTIKIGQALNCVINKQSKFDRKHYFYPDLPKGYQISQYDEPIAVKGYLEINTTPSSLHSATPPYKGGESINKSLLLEKEEYPKERQTFRRGEVVKKIGITRVHLEEDTGKLTHVGEDTLVDFNRSGVPLVEIVTEPDFDNSDDVKVFLEELHTIIRYLDVSDADMEKGSMRMEPNISLARVTRNVERVTLPNYKVEIKNINSFNFAKKAIEYELKRQAEILDSGKTPIQETRGYDDDRGITYSQRSKEEAHDYRYFPEPDIPPMEFGDEQLEKIKKTIPLLPNQIVKQLISMGVKSSDAFLISRNKKLTEYFQKVDSMLKIENSSQIVANNLVNKKLSIELSPEEFAKEIEKLSKPKQTDMGALTSAIEKAISANPKAVADYKSGKTNVLMFLVGQVMREMKGQADANIVRQKLEKYLK